MRNRFGLDLKPGTTCHTWRDEPVTYVRLDKPSGYSRAYGRQAVIVDGHMPIKVARAEAEAGAYRLVGIDDLRK